MLTHINPTDPQSQALKTLDVAKRLFLLHWHDEWGDDAYEPIEESLTRLNTIFAETIHHGDCTNQCSTCQVCLKEIAIAQAKSLMANENEKLEAFLDGL